MELINLKKITNRQSHIWTALREGTLIRLTPSVACNREDFDALPYHHQLWWRARAAAEGTYKAVLISRSAARMHGLWVITTAGEKVELTTPSGVVPSRSQWPEHHMYRHMPVPDRHWETFQGVRLTTAERTVIDIARFHGFAQGLAAVDSYLRGGGSREQLEDCLGEAGRLWRAKNARKAIEFGSALSESPYESVGRAIAIEAGFEVRPQVSVVQGVRVDLLIEGHVVLEVDGEVKYDGHTYGKATTFVDHEERKREKRIQNAGFVVLRYAPRELLREPDRVIADIRRALDSRRRLAS